MICAYQATFTPIATGAKLISKIAMMSPFRLLASKNAKTPSSRLIAPLAPTKFIKVPLHINKTK